MKRIFAAILKYILNSTGKYFTIFWLENCSAFDHPNTISDNEITGEKLKIVNAVSIHLVRRQFNKKMNAC